MNNLQTVLDEGRLIRGYWSRRIDSEHRLVYRTIEDGILIAQVRFHYA